MFKTPLATVETLPLMRTVLTYKSGAVRILGCLPAADLTPTIMMQTVQGLLSACLVKVTPLAAYYQELDRTWKDDANA